MEHLERGQYLKAAMKQKGYTIKDLAPKVGYSREHLNKLLNSNQIDDDLAEKISSIIGADIRDGGKAPGNSHRCEMLEQENRRLLAELETARQTIADLSAAIKHLTRRD